MQDTSSISRLPVLPDPPGSAGKDGHPTVATASPDAASEIAGTKARNAAKHRTEEADGAAKPERPIDVFISYRRSDGGFEAAAVEQALRERGVSVFRDKSNIGNGDKFPDAIRKAIRSAREIVLVCTPRYFGPDRGGRVRIREQDDWCRKELELALASGKKKKILPVSEEGCFPPAPENLPDSLAELPAVNIADAADKLTEDRLPGAVDALFASFSKKTRENSRRNAWEDRLSGLDPRDRSASHPYNVAIREVVLEKYECNGKIVARYILPLLENGRTPELRFSAFYAAYTFYRRMHETDALLELVEANREKAGFADIPFLPVALTQYHRLKYERNADAGELEKALECARTARDALPSNTGVLLSYAELVADAATAHRDLFSPLVEEGMRTIEDAIKLAPAYAKQYCVRGRLLAIQGKFREAIKDFRTAIGLEESEKKDAFLRMLQYQGFLQDAKLLQMEERLTEKFSADGRNAPPDPS